MYKFKLKLFLFFSSWPIAVAYAGSTTTKSIEETDPFWPASAQRQTQTKPQQELVGELVTGHEKWLIYRVDDRYIIEKVEL